MSMTVAFSTNIDVADFSREVAAVCARHEFGFSMGTDGLQAHVAPGLTQVLRFLGHCNLALIHAPGGTVPEAPLIYEQLVEGGDKELGVSFFEEIAAGLVPYGEYAVMICIEDWTSDMGISYHSGPSEELHTLLRRPCSWCEAVFYPARLVWSCNDERPFVFKVN